MSRLFQLLPSGSFHFQNFLSKPQQRDLVELCRNHLKEYPLMQPMTRAGYPLSLKVSSFGEVGWFARNGQYMYIEKHDNGKRWPPIPSILQQWCDTLVMTSGFAPFRIDTVLLNWYPPMTGKLGRHQDNTEYEHESPIITFSLGDTCLFNIGSPQYGDKGVDVNLLSGDVFVMGGESRMAYHEVKCLFETPRNDLMKNGGRISLTCRRVFK